MPRRLRAPVVALLTLACAGPPASDDSPMRSQDLSALPAEVRSDIGDARTQLAEATDSGKRTIEPLTELALLLHAHALPGLAREAYNELARLEPENERWPYYLGQLDLEGGDPFSALAHLEAAVTLNPNATHAHLARGEALLAAAEWSRAGDHYDDLLANRPRNTQALFGRARARLELDLPAAALEDLQYALEIEPSATAIHQQIARALRRLGRMNAAEKHSRRAGPIVPKSTDFLMDEVHTRRTGIHNQLQEAQRRVLGGQLESAADLYRRILVQEPTLKRARLNLASVAFQSGRFEEAEHLLEALIAEEPIDVAALFNLGTIQLSRGSFDEAAQHLMRAIELAPEHRDARFNLAQALRLMGDRSSALDQLRLLLELAPPEPRWFWWVAKLEVEQGDTDEATEILRRARAQFPGNPGFLSLGQIRSGDSPP